MGTIPYQTKTYQTELTVNLLQNSQNKFDLDENFTEASVGCCLKPDQTIPYQTLTIQTNCISSLKPPNQVRSFRWMLPQTKPNHIEPNQTLSVSLSLIVETNCCISK